MFTAFKYLKASHASASVTLKCFFFLECFKLAFTYSFVAALFTVTTRVEDSGGDAEEPLEVVDRDRAVKDLKASSAKAILNEL